MPFKASRRFVIFTILACFILIFTLYMHKRTIAYRMSFVNDLIPALLNPEDGSLTFPIDNSGFNYNKTKTIPAWQAPHLVGLPSPASPNFQSKDIENNGGVIKSFLGNLVPETFHNALGIDGNPNKNYPEDDVCIQRFKQNYTELNGAFIDKNVSISSLPVDFNFTINPSMMCFEFNTNGERVAKDIFIISMIHTAPAHFDNRDSIRETWGSIKQFFNYNIRLVFILGLTANQTVQDHIMNESRTHGDIVQASFNDAYNNLTYKISMGFKWISYHCPQADYILKLDDDIYVDIFQVINTLHNFKVKYGPFLDRNIDALRPQSKLFPYRYNQTNGVGMEHFDYLIGGKELQKRLEEEAKEHLALPPDMFRIGLPSQQEHSIKRPKFTPLNNGSDLDAQCKARHYTMLDINEDMRKEYDTLFPLNKNSAVPNKRNQIRDLIICLVMVNSLILREPTSKWYASPEQYDGNFYEPYCSGWAVILTPPVAYKLYKAYFTQPYFYIDDAHVTGKLARIAGTMMVNIDYTVHGNVHDLKKWVTDDQLSFINSNQTTPYRASSQFKYVFCYNEGNREKMKEYWNKTLLAHDGINGFLVKRK